MIVAGNYEGMVQAVISICRAVQNDRHLKEHLSLKYDIEVPRGAWFGGRPQPANPDTPLMSPDVARNHTKKELIDYLQKAAPKDFLVKNSIYGKMKNITKAKTFDELVEAVAVTWHARRGTTLEGNSSLWSSPSEDYWGNCNGKSDRSDTWQVYLKEELERAGLLSGGPKTTGATPPKSTVRNLIDFKACNVHDDEESNDASSTKLSEAGGEKSKSGMGSPQDSLAEAQLRQQAMTIQRLQGELHRLVQEHANQLTVNHAAFERHLSSRWMRALRHQAFESWRHHVQERQWASRLVPPPVPPPVGLFSVGSNLA